jgi:hypothetical protein
MSSAIRLNGDGSLYYSDGGYLDLPSLSTDLNDGFTVSLWVTDEILGGSPVNEEMYVSFGTFEVDGWVAIALNTGTSSVSFQLYDGAQIYKIDAPVNMASYTSRWKQLAFILEPGRFEGFIDGVSVGDISVSHSVFPVGESSLGRHWWASGSSARMSATLDSFRTYDRALSDPEVTALYVSEVAYLVAETPQFQIIEGNFTWQEAVADAEARGGRLAVLNTQGKIDAAQSFLDNLGQWPEFYIGLTDQDVEGDWRWIDGTILSASNWTPGEPGNSANITGQEDFVVVVSSNDPNNAGKWGDNSAYYFRDYIDVYTSDVGGYLLELLPNDSEIVDPEPLAFTLNGDGTEYSVSDCLETASGSLDIPSIYNGLPVTSIGSSAFKDCIHITSITIPDSVTLIGNGAFVNCTSLSSITIPDSVTSIGTNAFSYCTSLISVTIPDSVRSIRVGAFSHCTNLSSITIPNSVTSIRDHAFSSCSSLSSITIPESVKSIGRNAFSNCTNLSIITIPDSVTSIGDYAFYACSSLSSITIPDSVTSIGVGLFYSCSSLSSITIPDGVTSIGSSAFYSCTSLASITIPDSVTSIGRNAFGNTQGSISFSRYLLEAAEAERDARLTMDEVRDARVGSTMIEVSGGKADITMTLEETSDLNDWSSATSSEKTIEVDAPPGTRFYRFKMTE